MQQKAASGLARLGNPKTVILETRKRDGTWVGPVFQATARRLDGAKAEHARSLLAERFPVLHGRLVPGCTAVRGGPPCTTR